MAVWPIVDLHGDRFMAQWTAQTQEADFLWDVDTNSSLGVAAGPGQYLEVDSVMVEIQSDPNVATRRAELVLYTGSFFDVVRVLSSATQGANLLRRYQFSHAVTPAAPANVNLEQLPSGVMLLVGYTLRISISAVQAGDAFSEVIVAGRFRG